jgi:hypothetical protein
MSDPPALPSPEPEPELEPAPEPPKGPPPRRHSVLAWLSAAGFIVLAAAIAWVWQNPMMPPPPPSPPASQALEHQVEALQAQVARLEKRPPPAAPDLSALEARVAALEQRPAPAAAGPPNLGPLTARLDALEHQQSAELTPLEARIARLEDAGDTAITHLTQRVAAEDARFAALEKSAGLAARISAVRQALDAGHKLGDVPGAPPALAQYARVDPPTEASLRLAFPAASQAALNASRPSVEDKPFLTRIWARAQDLVTIRRGEHVLVGDPAAGLLATAQTALDAGDLAGAVRSAGALTGPAAQAMAGWLAQAKALLEARAALATWAAQG